MIQETNLSERVDVATTEMLIRLERGAEKSAKRQPQ
jgi:hypothetical protein